MDTTPTTNSVKAATSGGIKTAISTAETNAKNLANATGTLAIANGGTGTTTAKGAQKALLSDMQTETTAIDDSTEFVMKYGTPTDTTGAIFKRSATLVWNYIKGKISSILGLTATAYGGKAATAGTADKVASAGDSGMWIQGRANAICKITSAGVSGGGGWRTLASIKTSSGSIEIGNLSSENFIRIVYSSDTDVNAGNNNVSQIMELAGYGVEFPTAKASNKMVIPIGAPSQLEDGCIWIER